MSEQGKIYEFDADEMVQEMQFVMRKGLSKVLKDFIDRHELLEKTHKQIMQLPSVLNEINKDVSKDIDLLHDKIAKMEDKFGSSINQILELFKVMNREFVTLKNDLSKQTTHVKPQLKSSIVAACENENIKMEVEEKEEEENLAPPFTKEEEEEDNLAPPFTKVEEEEVEEEVEDEEEVEEEEVEEEVEEEEEEEESLAPTSKEEEDDDEIETEASSSDEEEDEEEEATLAPPLQKVEEEETQKDLAPPFLKVEKVEKVEEEEELFEIEIDDVTYCTNDEENGFIYALSEDGDVGDKVGYLKEGEPFFYADEK